MPRPGTISVYGTYGQRASMRDPIREAQEYSAVRLAVAGESASSCAPLTHCPLDAWRSAPVAAPLVPLRLACRISDSIHFCLEKHFG